MEFKIYNLSFQSSGGWKFMIRFLYPAFVFRDCWVSEGFEKLTISHCELPNNQHDELRKLIGDRIKSYLEKCPKEI